MLTSLSRDTFLLGLGLLVSLTAATQLLRADDAICPTGWATGFVPRGVDGPVKSLLSFDDGSGPALYVGGSFDAAGGRFTSGVARWDGAKWIAMNAGSEQQFTVYTLQSLDFGNGPQLYAAGYMHRWQDYYDSSSIVRWDGASWHDVGDRVEGQVYALAIFDDGSGAALYAGGRFLQAGDEIVSSIAKWSGSQWVPLGTGMSGTRGPNVYALAVHDDGRGPALYAGGVFSKAGSIKTHNIARWDGSSWSAVGGGLDDTVLSLAVFNDGTGPALYAGGTFHDADGEDAQAIAKWNGNEWTSLGDGFNDDKNPVVRSLLVYDESGESALLVGGRFSKAGGRTARNIAKWDGREWSSPGDVLGDVSALAVHDDGAGLAVYLGGSFSAAGGQAAQNVARLSGRDWFALGTGHGPNDAVESFGIFDDGRGPALYVGGKFEAIGGVVASALGRWDGATWSDVGGGLAGASNSSGVSAMASLDSGSDSALYLTGRFTEAGRIAANGVARWDGSKWSALGAGIDGGGSAIVSFDDGNGPAIYVAGAFEIAGDVSANNIAKWDGSNWVALGDGLYGGDYPGVNALTVFDDGSGPALIAAGSFWYAGNVSANGIARWDGSRWSAFDEEGVQSINTMTVFDDGFGAALYVAGTFSDAGGSRVNSVARWDGTGWSPLGRGLIRKGGQAATGYVLAVDGSSGAPALVVAGAFDYAGDAEARNVARWDGHVWSALNGGVGTNGQFAASMIGFDDGNGPALWIGGPFIQAGERVSSNIARWSLLQRGDMNCDGEINLSDVNGFVAGLISAAEYAAIYPDCDLSRGDVNCDGRVDFNDINAFVDCLVDGRCR